MSEFTKESYHNLQVNIFLGQNKLENTNTNTAWKY